MPDLVDLFLLSPSRVKLIWEVENHAVFFSNVFVGMHHSRRNGHEDRIVFSNHVHFMPVSLSRPRFPKVQLHLAEEKDKSIRLVDVLMRASADARKRDADVAHDRLETFRQLVVS